MLSVLWICVTLVMLAVVEYAAGEWTTVRVVPEEMTYGRRMTVSLAALDSIPSVGECILLPPTIDPGGEWWYVVRVHETDENVVAVLGSRPTVLVRADRVRKQIECDVRAAPVLATKIDLAQPTPLHVFAGGLTGRWWLPSFTDERVWIKRYE